jgi:tetratricopeptide (TPR) repeat protein
VKRLALTTLLASGFLFSAPAFAALDDATRAALTACQAEKTAPQQGIDACTKVLNSVKMGPKSTLQLHYDRGGFHLAAGNTDKAVEDFTAAVNAYESDPGKADWPADFVGLAASSYSFRAQAELSQNKCDAAKADYKKAAATTREVSEREDYEKRAQTICK